MAGCVAVVLTYFYVRKCFKEIGPYKFSFRKPIVEWKSLNIPFFIFSSTQHAVQRADILLLGLLGGPKNLAIYIVSLKIAQVLNFPAIASKAALAPRFSSLFEKNDTQNLSKLLVQSTLWLSVIGVILGGALYLLSPFILDLIGDVYREESLQIVPILIVAEALVCIFTSVRVKALMGTSQKFLSVVFGLGLIVSIALNLYFIPLYGAIAVAFIRLFVMFFTHVLIFLKPQNNPISANG